MSRFHQGKYKLRNPQKYKGDVSNCIYRSSWEYKFYVYCDHRTIHYYTFTKWWYMYMALIEKFYNKKYKINNNKLIYLIIFNFN